MLRKQGEERNEKRPINQIEPGMVVEDKDGDLGEQDVSKPKVTNVRRDEQGNVEKLVVQKGVIFKKELEIPADRVQQVEQGQNEHRSVVVDVHPSEINAFTPVGREAVMSEQEAQREHVDLLDKVQVAMPTTEGMRDLEMDAPTEQNKHKDDKWWRTLGPGLLGGLSGNDPSAVTAYAIDGAQNGFAHLWLMLLSTPMYQAALYSCAKIGRVTQKGFATLLRERYGQWVALLVALSLIIANVALIAADLVAIGSGFELVTGINWVWFVVPVGVLLWYLTVFTKFDTIKKVFIVMSLAFVAYIITAFFARPAWGNVLVNTFVPHLDFSFASISSAVALLGATMSPYTMFWQVQGEKEENRPGTPRQKLRNATIDITSGVVSGNVVAYFIIIATAATLFVHHKNITTAADAALAFVPIVGPLAKYLFAIGIIGAGMIAIPVLVASTSYAVADTFGWPAGLSSKPWQSEGFYLILTLSLVVSIAMALLHFDPIRLIFWSNIISGILAPVLLVCLFLIGNNRAIMGKYHLGWLSNLFLIISVLVLVVGTVLLFYGLFTGQGNS